MGLFDTFPQYSLGQKNKFKLNQGLFPEEEEQESLLPQRAPNPYNFGPSRGDQLALGGAPEQPQEEPKPSLFGGLPPIKKPGDELTFTPGMPEPPKKEGKWSKALSYLLPLIGGAVQAHANGEGIGTGLVAGGLGAFMGRQQRKQEMAEQEAVQRQKMQELLFKKTDADRKFELDKNKLFSGQYHDFLALQNDPERLDAYAKFRQQTNPVSPLGAMQFQHTLAKDARTEARQAAREAKEALGRDLPAHQVSVLGDLKRSPEIMTGLKEKMTNFKHVFGPISGRVRGVIPWDEDSQTLQSAIDLPRQLVGKAIEQGVLRKEDEAKYEKILPKISDTYTIAMKKADLVSEQLQKDYNNQLDTYRMGNFNVSGFNPFSIGGQQQETKSVYKTPQANAAPSGLGVPLVNDIADELKRRGLL